MTMHPTDLYTKLNQKFGKLNMILVAIEEMSELTKELTKYERKDYTADNQKQIVEEIADVMIVLDQLMWLFGNHDEVDQVVEDKICRTKERLDTYEN